jgi:rRNA-processing protein FCF1
MTKRRTREPVVAFLDTNIFLHYQPFHQISWTKELAASEVRIVLPRVVVGELDRHKDGNTNQRLRDRARDALARIRKIIMEEGGRLNETTSLQFANVLPQIDYHSLQLDKTWSDDQLLASVIHHQQTYPGEPVVLVTHDTGLELKAHGLGIPSVCLPDSLRVPDTADPLRKRIQELETENRELKRAIPQLSLAFVGGSNRRDLLLRPEVMITPEVAWEHVARSIMPKFQRRDPTELIAQADSLGSEGEDGREVRRALARFTKTFASMQAQNYNFALDRYFNQYVAYVVAWGEHQNSTRRTWQLPFIVNNVGTKPAEDVRVFLTIPSALIPFPELRAPTPPLPPGRKAPAPKTTPALASGHATTARTRAVDSFELRNVKSRAEIKELEYKGQRLNHHTEAELPMLTVGFASHDEAQNFSINYRVIAANTPRQVEGRLDIIVRPTNE